MKNISIDELINKVDSRYSLVTIISKRARQLIDGQDALIKTTTIKPVCVAIEEFSEDMYEAIYADVNDEAQTMESYQEQKTEEAAAEAEAEAEANSENEK